MNAQATPYSRRLHELEDRFGQLASQIPDGPEREGFSILHAMIQELWRNLGSGPATSRSQLTLDDIAELHRKAPPMDGEAENDPLPVGAVAPDLSLQDASGHVVSLADYRGRAVVLVFYPLDWSPTCSDQLSLYQQESREFERYGAQILAVSVDSIYSHGAWAAVRGLTFPLLADFEPKGEAARGYRVYRQSDGFSERAVYVVDADGVIRYSRVSPKLDHIPDIYELFNALDQLPSAAPAPATVGR
jgi:peroxiredoxin